MNINIYVSIKINMTRNIIKNINIHINIKYIYIYIISIYIYIYKRINSLIRYISRNTKFPRELWGFKGVSGGRRNDISTINLKSEILTKI